MHDLPGTKIIQLQGLPDVDAVAIDEVLRLPQGFAVVGFYSVDGKGFAVFTQGYSSKAKLKH